MRHPVSGTARNPRFTAESGRTFERALNSGAPDVPVGRNMDSFSVAHDDYLRSVVLHVQITGDGARRFRRHLHHDAIKFHVCRW